MKLLLDTHVFLWYIVEDARLPGDWKAGIRDRANDVYLSVASLWEVVIKSGLRKLVLPEPAELFIPAQRQLHGILSLPIDENTIGYLAKLPSYHRDPFDCIIVSQSQQHSLTLLSSDEMIARYDVPIFPS